MSNANPVHIFADALTNMLNEISVERTLRKMGRSRKLGQRERLGKTGLNDASTRLIRSGSCPEGPPTLLLNALADATG
jgi:hypothetical protein